MVSFIPFVLLIGFLSSFGAFKFVLETGRWHANPCFLCAAWIFREGVLSVLTLTADGSECCLISHNPQENMFSVVSKSNNLCGIY